MLLVQKLLKISNKQVIVHSTPLRGLVAGDPPTAFFFHHATTENPVCKWSSVGPFGDTESTTSRFSG